MEGLRKISVPPLFHHQKDKTQKQDKGKTMNLLSSLFILKIIGAIILVAFLVEGLDIAQNIAIADFGSALDKAADPRR